MKIIRNMIIITSLVLMVVSQLPELLVWASTTQEEQAEEAAEEIVAFDEESVQSVLDYTEEVEIDEEIPLFAESIQEDTEEVLEDADVEEVILREEPANAVSSGVKNIVARAYQQVNIAWTPVKDVKGYVSSTGTLTKTYYEGTTYNGITYGQVPTKVYTRDLFSRD